MAGGRCRPEDYHGPGLGLQERCLAGPGLADSHCSEDSAGSNCLAARSALDLDRADSNCLADLAGWGCLAACPAGCPAHFAAVPDGPAAPFECWDARLAHFPAVVAGAASRKRPEACRHWLERSAAAW